MGAAGVDSAEELLRAFFAADTHYLDVASVYGDAGPHALRRALGLFVARPELGFVWMAWRGDDIVGCCVVCYAISTSRGGLVAKLDDVNVDARWQGQGVGGAMLSALAERLRAEGFHRIDTACHRGNADAWRFYAARGYQPLDEERIALLL